MFYDSHAFKQMYWCSDLSVVGAMCARALVRCVCERAPQPNESAENERMEKPKYEFSVTVGLMKNL